MYDCARRYDLGFCGRGAKIFRTLSDVTECYLSLCFSEKYFVNKKYTIK